MRWTKEKHRMRKSQIKTHAKEHWCGKGYRASPNIKGSSAENPRLQHQACIHMHTETWAHVSE